MKALLLEQHADGQVVQVKNCAVDELPPGDVIVDIHWSTLNYKDALAITGKGKIVRQFPMIPGIDFSGTVNHSTDPRFKIGQQVLLTGWGVGENHWGGLATQARVPANYLTAVPDNLSLRQAMIIGTAGFTAMLCVMALQDSGITPEHGDIIVTGASGGVGSTAIQLLSRLGYSVTAVTGRAENSDYLYQLGAKNILSRNDFPAQPRPLNKQRWAGGVDTVGGHILAAILAETQYNGTVAACGLAGGIELSTTVMPFILRNIRLQGIDSVHYPAEKRAEVWQRLASLLPESFYQQVACEISLAQAADYAEKLINNQITGRILVDTRS